MIQTKTEFGENEICILKELSLETQEAKKQAVSLKIWLAVLAVILVVLAIMTQQIIYICGAAGIILFAIVAIKPIQKIGVNKIYKNMDERLKSGERIYTIDEQGITIDSARAHGFHRWDSFIEYGMKSEYIWIKRMDNQMILIRKKQMSTDEYQMLMDYLKENIQMKKNK